jgi:hypothetical protein
MRELEATRKKHLSEVTQAQLVPQPPEHHLEDNIGGVFQIIESRSRTLVEDAFAR